MLICDIKFDVVTCTAPTTVAAMPADPPAFENPSLTVHELEQLEKEAVAGLEAIGDQIAMAADELAEATALYERVVGTPRLRLPDEEPVERVVGTPRLRLPDEEPVAAADERVNASPRLRLPTEGPVAAADERVNASPRLRYSPRLRLPVAKVYGAGPLKTGRPGIGARARRHVPLGASKWHKLWHASKWHKLRHA